MFLVDDHDLVRTGVRVEIGDDVDVVGEASGVEAAVELTRWASDRRVTESPLPFLSPATRRTAA